jgi:hypothetical protein
MQPLFGLFRWYGVHQCGQRRRCGHLSDHLAIYELLLSTQGASQETLLPRGWANAWNGFRNGLLRKNQTAKILRVSFVAVSYNFFPYANFFV